MYNKLAVARRTVSAGFRARGSVAIEVLIITPVMLMILFGFSEVYMYMRAMSMVDHTAFTLANSLAQMPNVLDTTSTSGANTLGSLWSDAAQIAVPDALQANGGVIITSVCDDTSSTNNNCGTISGGSLPQSGTASISSTSAQPLNGKPTICWQAEAGWTGTGMQSQVTSTNVLPSAWPFYQGDAALVVEVFYRYNPFPMLSAFWPGAPGASVLYRRVYVRPYQINWTAMVLLNSTGTAGVTSSTLSTGCPGSTLINGA
jgi:hypothetical protein